MKNLKQTRKSLRNKGKERNNENIEDSTKPWHCIICSTEENSKIFQDVNELVYHHMSHSILDLAQALADIQKLLKNVRLFDKFLSLKNEKLTEENEIIETENVVNDEVLPDESTEDIVATEVETKPATLVKQKRFECQVCHKVLSSRGNLNKHLVIHDESKKFKCDQCEAKFNQVRDLNTHIMSKHTGERPHICKICGKGFVHKHYLSEHMDYHTGERKHQCPTCGKRYQSTSTLAKHVERHKGERSHKCPHCSKSFLVHVDLRSHVRIVHEKAGHTGIPLFSANDKPVAEIPLNYAPVQDVKEKPSDGFYQKPVPVLRMNQVEDWLLQSSNLDEIRMIPTSSSGIAPDAAAKVESLTLTNMENHSQTMIVLPMTSNQ